MILDWALLIISSFLYLSPFDFDGYKNLYTISALVLVYQIIRVTVSYKKDNSYFFISPIFLSVLFTFFLQLGVLSNLILFAINGGNEIYEYNSPLESEKQWMPKAMYLTCWASFFYWKGYNSNFGIIFFNWLKKKSIYIKLFKGELSDNKLMYLAVFAYLFKAYLYSIGLFGRVLSEEYFVAGEGYKGLYFIREFGNLSYVTFFLISLNKFSDNSPKNKILFYASLVLELFFGFIYGARSTFVYPILLLFVANYRVRQRVNKLMFVIVLPITLIMSVTVVLSYKNFTTSKDFVKSKSVFEIYNTYMEYQKYTGKSSTGESSILDASKILVTNTCFVQESSMAIRYADQNPKAGEIRNKILKNFFLIPIDAVIPKFIQGDNNFPWGLWFKDEVVQHNVGLNYSLAFSPIGFLYLGGGFFLVILFFGLYGIFLKVAFCILKEKSQLSFLLYLMALVSLYNFDTVVSGVTINFIRALIIYPFIFWILFGKFRLFKKV
jgi:hypothetical protein